MYKIAVIGATGRVGAELFSVLEERAFPFTELYALASKNSEGEEITCGKKIISVQSLENFDFANIDIAFFVAGSQISEYYVPLAVKEGVIVIDNTSLYRNDPDIPLIIPEVNGPRIAGYRNKSIISNPNCTTTQMLVALAPLHHVFKIKRIVASTYQSVSGAGSEALDELFDQTKSMYTQQAMRKSIFTKQIAFNVIPHIDEFLPDGDTKEERKMLVETQKILEEEILVTATCVRVPVFIGHAVSLNVEFNSSFSENDIRDILQSAPGVSLIDYRQNEGYVTPLEASGEDKVYVSRLRVDQTQANTINMWVVSDNLRKGAALNSVQIAEELIKIL